MEWLVFTLGVAMMIVGIASYVAGLIMVKSAAKMLHGEDDWKGKIG